MSAKILHVSDIHFGLHSETEHDPDVTYRDAMVEVVRESAGKQTFDAIFVTGDVAERATKAEYAIARKWIEDVAGIVGCSTKFVYVVPGNHDVDRHVTKSVYAVQTAQLSIAAARTDADRERQFKAAMLDPDVGPALFRPLQNYNDFARHFDCEIGPTERGMWMRWLSLGHGYRLKIFGLNSVLLSSCMPAGGGDKKNANLYVGPQQQVFRTNPGEIVASLIHHPTDWLLDHQAHKRALKDRSTLHFEGHVHEREVDVGDNRLTFSAGALSPNRHGGDFEPGFNIIVLDVVKGDNGGYSLEVDAEVWAWQKDPGRFRLHQNREGAERWKHSLKLKTIPANEPPAIAVDRLPPPVPSDTAGVGPAIQRFWELPGSAKLRIATHLGVLSDDERRLPERYRYNNVFKRAAAAGKVEELINAVRAEDA